MRFLNKASIGLFSMFLSQVFLYFSRVFRYLGSIPVSRVTAVTVSKIFSWDMIKEFFGLK